MDSYVLDYIAQSQACFGLCINCFLYYFLFYFNLDLKVKAFPKLVDND